MIRKNSFRYIPAAVLLCLVALAPGCSKKLENLDKPAATSNPPIVKSVMGFGTTNGEGRGLLTDNFAAGATTRLEVAIWYAYIDGEINHVNVGVDPGFVMVGGGASVSDITGMPINAVLTSAYPVNDGTFSTFAAASKDHGQVYNHRLFVYAIGIRLYGPTGAVIPAADVAAHFHIRQFTSAVAHHPAQIAPSGGYIISGGADIQYGTGPGNLLVQNTISLSSAGIYASGKDHVFSSPASITAYCLYMDADPIPGFGNLLVQYGFGSTSIFDHFQVTNIAASPPYLTAGIGATSNYVEGNQGRLLSAFFPVDGRNAIAASKDQLKTDLSGTLDIQISELFPAQ